MAKTPEEIEAEKRAAQTRTVREIATEAGVKGVIGASKLAVKGAKAASKMKRGAEQYVGDKLKEGAGALGDRVSEMTPAEKVGAASTAARMITNPLSAIGDIEVGGAEGAASDPRSDSKEEFDKEMASAQGFLDDIEAKRAAGPSDLMKQANQVIADMKSRQLKTDLAGQSTAIAGGSPEKVSELGDVADSVMAYQNAGKIKAKPLKTTGAYNDAMAAFNEKFPSKRGGLIAKEGETGDEFSDRLKERNAARDEVQKLAPISVAQAPSTPDKGSPSTQSPSTQVRDTANTMSQSDRLKGRQAFGSYLNDKLDQGGGSYSFSEADNKRAQELGIGRKELGNFGRRREREKRNQFGARGGLS
jgi:hypothetical protein